MTLIELLIATVLLIVVITIGFVVTTSTVNGTTATQRHASLTGPAQNGMQVLRDLFAGAVQPQTVTTSPGAQLYTDGCAGGTTETGTAGTAFPPNSGATSVFPSNQGPFVSAAATDVVLCSVRSGANAAYTYHVLFTGSACTTTGNCTLTIRQEPPLSGWTAPTPTKPAAATATTIETIPNVYCTPCLAVSPSGTLPFKFSTNATGTTLNAGATPYLVPSGSLSSAQAVQVTLTLASSTQQASSTTYTTLTSQVFMPNALGGSL